MTGHAEFHHGDAVNVMRKGTLAANVEMSSAVAESITAASNESTGNVSSIFQHTDNGGRQDILYATVSGAIGSIMTVTPEQFKVLRCLEKAILKNKPAVGQLDHAEYREFKNERRRYKGKNWVDGDLIESLLDCTDVYEMLPSIANDTRIEYGKLYGEGTKKTGKDGNVSAISVKERNLSDMTITPENILQIVEEMRRRH
jgi:hypothetical protein